MDFINLLLQQFNIDVELTKLIQKAWHIKQCRGRFTIHFDTHFFEKKMLTF